MTARVERALAKLRKQAEALKARLGLPEFANPQAQQSQTIRHFVERTLQFVNACDLLVSADLDTPIIILTRVICEDAILCFWIARSEADAAEYCKAVDGESIRLVRIMLENNRGVIRSKSTKEDKTAETLQKLKGMNTDGFKIEQVAAKVGLHKLYDILYRFPSMHVHGKSFGDLWGEKEGGVFAAISAVASVAEAVGLIADNRMLRNQATSAEEVLRLLRIENLGGK
jgi:Family of unknown function (DUF5677)